VWEWPKRVDRHGLGGRVDDFMTVIYKFQNNDPRLFIELYYYRSPPRMSYCRSMTSLKDDPWFYSLNNPRRNWHLVQRSRLDLDKIGDEGDVVFATRIQPRKRRLAVVAYTWRGITRDFDVTQNLRQSSQDLFKIFVKNNPYCVCETINDFSLNLSIKTHK